MPSSHHEPFAALGPVDWSTIPADDLTPFLADTFSSAQTIIDSIPVPAPVKAATATAAAARRSRAQTDPPLPSAAINASIAARQSGASISAAQDLMKEWKEVKVNAKDNPLAINVYKLAAKDGRGSWFARRSIHDGLTFEKWKLGLEREFAESMKVQTGPGGGSIRGIGAEKKVEDHFVREAGKAEVFQLSAQFPGPTAPRDFVTLLLSSDTADPKTLPGGVQRPLRTFMILSKPCEHPECPPRQGYIRGQYESVEIIREVPSDKPGAIRRARSSIDVGAEGSQQRQEVAEDMGKEAVLRAANQIAGGREESRNRGLSVDSAPARDDAGHRTDAADEDDEDVPTTIEWLMVTRSDPGGNVPRFMIERGTPGGIVSDASKFLKWLTAKAARDFSDAPPAADGEAAVDDIKTNAVQAEESKARSKSLAPAPTANLVPDNTSPNASMSEAGSDGGIPSSNGLYGMISGAFGYASEAVAGRLPVGLPGFFQSQPNSSDDTLSYRNDRDDEEDSLSDISDTSSVRSFTSAVERTESNENAPSPDTLRDDAVSVQSSESRSLSGPLAHSTTHHEKELRKLQERRRKMQDKLNKLQTRMSAKRSDGSQKDEAAASKLREKHEREVAKQEEKYQRELRRLEEKRAHDERKAVARKRKQEERELKTNAAMELDKVRQERDLALHEVELLKAQVGELQGQNTRLVAEMGKLGKGITGLKRQDSTWSSRSGPVRAPEKVPQAAASS